MSSGTEPTLLRRTLTDMRKAIVAIGVLSAVLNILLLSGSLYMMLVYDSVLPSHSIPTLVGALLMVSLAYLFQGIFDFIRSRMLGDISGAFDRRLAGRVQFAMFEMSRRAPQQQSAALVPMRDLDNIRAFLSGPGPGAFMDFPWILFFLIVLGALHIWLAVVTAVGALLMVGLTYLTHRASEVPTAQLSRQSAVRSMIAEERRQHAELINVLGMERRTRSRWMSVNREYLHAQESLSRTSQGYSGVARIFRMFLQSMVLTVGALLVLDGKASGGVIFASSILSARALAPIDQVISQWRSFATARSSWTRLGALLGRLDMPSDPTTILPRPVQELLVDNISVAPPGSQRIVVQNVGFRLNAGDVLGVVGLSGSGKSSLARAIVNAWPPARGTIRLDGAALSQFAPEDLAAYIGYLPQSIELFDGTVAENISRFDGENDSRAVIAAAMAAGVHELIVSLPEGYDSPLGPNGSQLSTGQRQRIALARALYRDPFLVVLDEPNSALDAHGEAALDRAIMAVQARRGIAVIVAHRAAAVNRANYIMVMRDGVMQDFGPKADIIRKLTAGERPTPGVGQDPQPAEEESAAS